MIIDLPSKRSGSEKKIFVLLFCHGALYVIVLNDDIFFEDLDGENFVRGVLLLGQHDLSERTLAQHFKETEVL